jgi:hypothetical protein
MDMKYFLQNFIEQKLEEKAAKIACLKCDEVSTAAAWQKKGGFCPKCKVSNQGVAESVELDEKVEVDHSRYMRSHGKKARGRGMWMFTSKDMGLPSDDEMVTVNGDLTSAAKEAAKKLGSNRVYVMEEVELDESFKVGDKVTYQKSKRERGNAVISSISAAKKNHFYLKTEKEGTIMVPRGELELVESIELTEDAHNDLNDIIFEFQKKIMKFGRSNLDAKIAKKLKEIDNDLDDLRSDLFKIRPGR